MPAAVAIGVAAASMYAAKKQADASKAAASTQAGYGNRALDLQREQWQRAQQLQQPYVDTGSAAVQRLGMRASVPPPQMPMFNGAVPGGGWTPQSYGAQAPANRYAAFWAQPNLGPR